MLSAVNPDLSVEDNKKFSKEVWGYSIGIFEWVRLVLYLLSVLAVNSFSQFELLSDYLPALIIFPLIALFAAASSISCTISKVGAFGDDVKGLKKSQRLKKKESKLLKKLTEKVMTFKDFSNRTPINIYFPKGSIENYPNIKFIISSLSGKLGEDINIKDYDSSNFNVHVKKNKKNFFPMGVSASLDEDIHDIDETQRLLTPSGVSVFVDPVEPFKNGIYNYTRYLCIYTEEPISFKKIIPKIIYFTIFKGIPSLLVYFTIMHALYALQDKMGLKHVGDQTWPDLLLRWSIFVLNSIIAINRLVINNEIKGGEVDRFFREKKAKRELNEKTSYSGKYGWIACAVFIYLFRMWYAGATGYFYSVVGPVTVARQISGILPEEVVSSITPSAQTANLMKKTIIGTSVGTGLLLDLFTTGWATFKKFTAKRKVEHSNFTGSERVLYCLFIITTLFDCFAFAINAALNSIKTLDATHLNKAKDGDIIIWTIVSIVFMSLWMTQTVWSRQTAIPTFESFHNYLFSGQKRHPEQNLFKNKFECMLEP